MIKFAHIPTSALYDPNLSDGELRTLGKLLELMWKTSPSSPETAPLHWSEARELLGLSKTAFFRTLKVLRLTGWIESFPSGKFGHTIYRIGPNFGNGIDSSPNSGNGIDSELIPNSGTIPKFGNGYSRFPNLGPTTTIKDINSLNNIKDLSSSSDSSPNSGNGIDSEPVPNFEIEFLIREKREFLKSIGIGEPLRSNLAEDPEIVIDWIKAHVRYYELRRDSRRILAHRLKVRDPLPGEPEFAEADPEGPEARARYFKGWLDP